ncbi:DNA-protecting protein DprA [Weissella cibaria]|uniref:DNA-protecting protein DprA n=2 Tax=Weissella cibaria TaxID=137591 RepID=A0A9Q8N9X2_9LACO|nr:DNA-protecting protein DprA [Weissella cibaria]TVV41770.1 DNA-protecting protein DprA [Weissella cibaria]
MTQRDFLLWIRLLPGIGLMGRHKIWQFLQETQRQRLTLQEIFTLTELSAAAQTKIRVAIRSGELRRIYNLVKQYPVVTLADDAYPELLREIAQPPLCLFFQGDFALVNQPCVAIVGARELTPYGQQVLATWLPHLVGAKLVTVSGLARGTDEAVHRGTMAHAGQTIAVIGTGVDVAYPKRRDNLQTQISQQGLILSEYLPWEPPAKHHFPERNRIIAGLAQATVIVEARQKSGSLITANVALDENRVVMAVPGPVTSQLSAGTNALIVAGAIPLISPAQILAEYINAW